MTREDLLTVIVKGCSWAEHAWLTSSDQKRVAKAQRLFWSSTYAPLDQLLSLVNEATSTEGDEPMNPKTLTDKQKADLAKALGLDLGKIDWTKILSLIQFLLSLFGLSPKPPAPAGRKAKAGCEDTCCCCTEAGMLALHSAMISFDCACDCSDPC